MARRPRPRVTRVSLYSPGGELAQHFKAGTWLESEDFAYPSGGFTRRAYAVLVPNRTRPGLVLPYGRHVLVRASLPDTAYSIPARWRYRGRTIPVVLLVRQGVLVAAPDVA